MECGREEVGGACAVPTVLIIITPLSTDREPTPHEDEYIAE